MDTTPTAPATAATPRDRTTGPTPLGGPPALAVLVLSCGHWMAPTYPHDLAAEATTCDRCGQTAMVRGLGRWQA